jgi:hypothetical protein
MAGGNYDRSQKKSQLNPAVSYAFALEVEAAFFLPLKSVRVFTKENEFDYYQEGGLNDYVHMLRKPISKPFTFQVERYVGVDAGFFDMNSGFIDPLALGTDLILPVILYVNRAPAGKFYNNWSFENCARAYIFTGCTVTAKEYGELNAEQSKLLTETTTIAYRELFTINQISPAWEKGGVWKMDKDNYLGTGESHTENRATGNDSKKTREAAAESSRWQISKDAFDGNKKYHTRPEARANDTKITGEKRGNDGKWQISKDAFDGNKKYHTRPEARSNDPKSAGESKGAGGKWEIDKDKYSGNDKYHTDERGRKNDSKSTGESKGKDNQWIYDGSVNGSGKSHPQNRNTNEKPTPVIWPPTRRAMRAQELSKK